MQVLFEACSLFCAKRRTVDFGSAALGRRAVTDYGFAGNKGRARRLLSLSNGSFDGFVVMAVNAQGIPTYSLKTAELVGGIGISDVAVYCDVIIVPQDYKLVELQVAG